MPSKAAMAGLALALASQALAVPAWFPRDFAPVPERLDSGLGSYLEAERLAFEPAIHRMGVVRSGDKDIACHLWIPADARATVFLVHGFYNHSGTWSPHIRRWTAQGLAVVAFDLPGHGLSDGRRMDIDSVPEYAMALEAVEDSLRNRVPLPWMVVGHSLGGTVVLERGTRPEYPYARSILLAPLVRYADWSKIGIALPLVGLTTDHVERKRDIHSSSDTAFLRTLLTDPLEGWRTGISWLRAIRRWNERIDTARWAISRWTLLQGDLDGTIDVDYQARWFPRHFPDLPTLRFPAARHHLHNESAPEGDRVRASLDSILISALSFGAK
ncbi:MAG TPA: alpha/beta fold hydrolase [Fibrobacteria bacterium]|nr:alpha/beta fold hydrolase [Fibrobacteria bacterium]